MSDRLDASISCEDEIEVRWWTLREKEALARDESRHGAFLLFLINGYAAFRIFILHLISLESIFSIVLSVSLTLLTYNKADNDTLWNGGSMDWILLSFAIVIPMSASIGMAFTRRESALKNLAIIRATMLELYVAHAIWDWSTCDNDNSGRNGSSVNWREHSDRVLNEIYGIGDGINRFLTLPNASRARHRVTGFGRSEACAVLQVSQHLFDSLLFRIGNMSLYSEVLKHEGLPPNEATRVRQWERDVTMNLDLLRMLKNYRTPQALRSLCRIFSVFLPPFYAPYYAAIAREISLGMGIAFSMFTSLVLTALFESLFQMEGPFVGHISLDGIDCYNEVRATYYHQLLNMRTLCFPHAPPFEDKILEQEPTAVGGRGPDQPRIYMDSH